MMNETGIQWDDNDIEMGKETWKDDEKANETEVDNDMEKEEEKEQRTENEMAS